MVEKSEKPIDNGFVLGAGVLGQGDELDLIDLVDESVIDLPNYHGFSDHYQILVDFELHDAVYC